MIDKILETIAEELSFVFLILMFFNTFVLFGTIVLTAIKFIYPIPILWFSLTSVSVWGLFSWITIIMFTLLIAIIISLGLKFITFLILNKE